ncbi:hypothetical protein NQD34_001473 [Periophthalmus magnuspinnatus]|nr:hypothetical protein NQD34_001473 [Periophthalmus magnuspinnatus]
MKAAVGVPRRNPQLQSKKRGRDYAAFMFKAHKEVGSGAADTRTSDFFLRQSRGGIPRPVLLRLISAEAFRLSQNNRLKTVTLQEVQEAVKLIRQRTRAKPAA